MNGGRVAFEQAFRHPPGEGRRIESLECLRGFAALSVVAWHLLIGFAPFQSGQFAASVPNPVIGRLWFAPFNGSAAVSFFFVLSGFVLPWAYFNSGDLGQVSRGLLKRWPRLAGACTLTTLGSWLLFASGAYHFVPAAEISGSPWLKDFAYAGLAPGFQPHFWPALLQGAFFTFFSGESYLNSSLWTMRPEIVGSIVVLGVAPVLRHLRHDLVAICLTVLLALMFYKAQPHVPQFLAGTLLARLLAGRPLFIPGWLALCMGALAFWLFGFFGARGAYAWLAPFGLGREFLFPVLWVPASLLLILAAIGCPRLDRLLSGGWARRLGQLSFPIYLVHVPVLCSLGAWTYVATIPGLGRPGATAVTVVAVLAGTLAAALLVGGFDRWWIARVNRAVRAVVPGNGARGGLAAGLEPGLAVAAQPAAD